MKPNRSQPKAKHSTGRRSKKRSGGGGGGVAPRTLDEFFALSERAQDQWIRITNAISDVRAKEMSIPQAAHEYGLDPRTVVRLGKSALRKLPNGRYAAKPTDDLLRVLVIPTSDGLREIAVRNSREASVLGTYWAAAQNYLRTGDLSALGKIRRKTVTGADGKRVRLIKDVAELDRLGSAGVLSFESMYARVA